MPSRKIETAMIITGDDAGGIRVLKATDQQVKNLNKSVSVSKVSIDKYNKSLNTSSKSFNKLSREIKGAVGFFSAGLLARETVRMADAMQALDARLRLVTDNTFEYARAQQAVRDISNQTFQSLQAVGTFYARIENATKGTSISQEELLTATKALNNAFRAYGVTGSEAASATLQLSQALSKGKLDGDEFRSVLENAPPVVEALTKELGIAKKELFEYSKEGKIGVQDLVNALVNSADEFAKASAQIPTKTGEAITVLKNQFADYIADVNTTYSVTEGLSTVILFLADNIDGLIKVIAGGAAIKLLAPTLNTIGAAALTTLGAVNRFGIGLVALNTKAAATTATLKGLRTSLALLGGPAGLLLLGAAGVYALANSMDSLIGAGTTARRTLDDVAEALDKLKPGSTDSEYQKLRDSLADINDQLDEMVQQSALDALDTGMGRLATSSNRAREALEKQKLALLGQINLHQQLNRLIPRLIKTTKEYAKAKREQEAKALREASELEAKRLKLLKEKESIEKDVIELLKTYGTQAEKIAIAQKEYNDELERAKKIGKATPAVIDALNKKLEEQVERIKDVKEELTDQQILWQEYDQLISDLSIDDSARQFVLLEARIEEMAAKMNLSKDEVTRLKEALYELVEASEQTGKSLKDLNKIEFGQGFDELISQGRTLQDIFGQISQGFSQGLQGGAQSVALIAGGLESVFNVFQSTAGDGRDTVGRLLETANQFAPLFGPIGETISQIATAVNSITGGRLFGTSFERESSSFNATIGSSGASGFTETIDVRQRSLFRGRQWRSEIEQLSGQALDSILAVFDQMSDDSRSLAEVLGTTAAELLNATFRQEFDAEGNLTLSQSNVGGQVFSDQSFDDFALRAIAQQRIVALDAAFEQIERQIIETFDIREDIDGVLGQLTQTRTVLIGEASAITEAYRDNAQQLAEVTDALVLAGIAVRNGEGLTDSLTTSFELTRELINGSETYSQSFQRLQAQTQLTQESIDILGVSLGLNQEAFVRFADTLAESVGGLPQLGVLWSNFFTQFFSPEQLLDIEIASLSDTINQQAQNIGIDASISESEFAALFKERLPQLTAEQVGQWLEFANSLSRVNDLVDQQNQILAEQAQSIHAYNEFAGGLRTELSLLNGTTSAYAQSVAEIRQQEQQNIDTLHQLAIEAGFAGAAEEDLANAHQLATNQILRAQEALRSTILSGIDELYGDNLENRIAELEARQVSSIETVGQASDNFYEAQLRGLKRLRDTVNDVLFDENLSPLEREQQLQLALSQFNDAVAAFNGGDTAALDDINNLYRTAIEIARDTRASGEDYNQIVFGLNEIINGLEVNASPAGTPSGRPQVGISAELQTLYDERDARLEQQSTEHRLRLATQLAQQLAEYSGAVRRPVLDLLDEFNVNVVSFLNDLGINVENATGETIAQLAVASNTLGVNLLDLGAAINETVTLSLGTLADEQSLLNDGLEAILTGIPEEFRDQITPLFTALEEAADGEAQELALAALEAATSELPVEYRNQLAPFFDGIDVTNEAQEQVTLLTQQFVTAKENLEVSKEHTDHLRIIQGQATLSNRWLEQIANEIKPSNDTDQAAAVSFQMGAVVTELRDLRRQNAQANFKLERLTQQIQENTAKTAEKEDPVINPAASRVA